MATIVIDAYQAAPHITGSDRVSSEMLRELQKLDSTNRYIIMVNAAHDFIPQGITAPNFEIYRVTARKRAIWLTFRLPFILRRLKADVFFSFHNLSGPGFRTCRTIGSLLDMIPMESPELYFGKEGGLRKVIVTTIMRRSVKTASEFVAISEYTKQIAVKLFNLDPKLITVLYLQASPSFFEPITATQLKAAAERYQLPPQFVLAQGTSEPRKNVSALITAHRAMPTELRAKFPLMIMGAKWHNNDVPLDNDKHIKLTGFVDDTDLPSVFKLASVFAFPTTYEGFGIPVLEAMAVGTPVIASDVTSLPEVTGDAALTFDPYDQAAITASLRQILNDDKLRAELSAKGDKQVLKFSWAQSAKLLQQLLTKVAS